ncbi:819_t:CDS:1, partial [Cetraspora pellucida]
EYNNTLTLKLYEMSKINVSMDERSKLFYKKEKIQNHTDLELSNNSQENKADKINNNDTKHLEKNK